MSFVVDVTELWGRHKPTAVRSNRRAAHDDSKLLFEIDASHYLATIEVWEAGHCLDVTVLKKHSAGSVILSAGPCSSITEAEARVARLVEVLVSDKGASDA